MRQDEYDFIRATMDNANSSGEAMRLIDETLKVDAPVTYPVPGPYELAVTFGAAMVASGKADSIGAAMAQAWAAIPEFYKARDNYTQHIAPIIMGYATIEEDDEEKILLKIGGSIREGDLTPVYENLLASAMLHSNQPPPETIEDAWAFLANTPDEGKGPKFPQAAVNVWLEKHTPKHPQTQDQKPS